MAGLEDRRSTQTDRPQWNPGALAATASAPREAPDPWSGTVLDGRYEILDRIGQGGIASVYRARERGLIHRDVAIKLLTLASSNDHDTVARFRNEAQVIAGIHHPNVVQIHHVDRAPNGQLYIVMELLPGQNLLETLRDLAAEGEAIPWRRLAPMMLQVCAALHAAHTHGVIHRDIKPNNCFRVAIPGTPDFIKVLDFGIAKAEPRPPRTDGARGPLTLPERFVGTPRYAAPELIDPRRGWPVDGRVDVFAVGVMMYQCLTGELPFADQSDRAALESTLRDPPPSPRDRCSGRGISREVDDLVARAMARHPDHRFPDIAALAAAIRGAASELSVVTVGSIVDPPLDDTVATVRRSLPRHVGTRRVDAANFDSTPHSPLHAAPSEPITVPVHPISDPSTDRDSRAVLVTYVLMGLGLVALLILLVREVTREKQPTIIKIGASTDLPRTVGTRSLPGDPPVEGTTTAPGYGAAADDPLLLEEAAPPPLQFEPPTAFDRRRRKIADVAQELADTRHLLDCLIDVTQRWRLPLILSVGPGGKLLGASASPRAPRELRLADDQQACLLRVLDDLSFPRGTDIQTVQTTVRGGPP
jgi:serine/threonine protein kinase